MLSAGCRGINLLDIAYIYWLQRKTHDKKENCYSWKKTRLCDKHLDAGSNKARLMSTLLRIEANCKELQNQLFLPESQVERQFRRVKLLY